MAHRHHRSSSHRRTPLKYYVIIAVACGVVALVAQYLFEAPDRVRRLAEERIESAVRDAVKDEVRRAQAEPGQ